MAQLRQDDQEFVDRDAELVVVGPEDQRAFQDYWRREELPFVGLADPSHAVAQRYGQESRLLKLGRLPALMVVDRTGRVVYRHYGTAMSDIPRTQEVVAILDELNRTVAETD